MNSIQPYRKTLLISSIVLFAVIFFHLIWSYIYSNGKYVGLAWGSSSVGVISSSIPDPLNPFLYGTGKIDDMMYEMLFRSLIRYNPQKGIYEGDLASCDMTDLKKISCSLRDDALWSDGTKVTPEDVTSTLKTFQEKALSDDVRNALKATDIQNNSWAIVISSNEENPNIVTALSYPILRSDTLDLIKNNRLRKEMFIGSGPFIFDDITKDAEYWFVRVALKKNPNYKKTVWLDGFSFKIFPDAASLEKWTDATAIILPPNNKENLTTSSLFKRINYATNEYYSLFFQTQKLDINLRNAIHSYLAKEFKHSAPSIDGTQFISSLFSTGTAMNWVEPKMTLENFMTDKGYKKKSKWLIEIQNTPLTNSWAQEIPQSKYFVNSDGYSILFSNDPKEEISLYGKVPESTEAVIINDYRLQEYQWGNTSFTYKISREIGNLKTGKNIYNLTLLQKNWEKLTDTLTIYHSLDANELAGYQASVNAELQKINNSPEKIAEREKKRNELLAKINAITEDYYINKNFEPFTLNLAYMSEKEAVQKYTDFIAASLKKIGINVKPLPLTTKEIAAMIRSWKKDYDAIVVGVSSPGGLSELGTAFFSSKNGNPNFSNLQSNELEKLFLNLQTTPDIIKLHENEEKIVNYINTNSIFMPISQPIHAFYIDRNIKWLVLPETLRNITDFAHIFDTLSIRDYYAKDLSTKSVSGFFGWMNANLKK